MNLTMMRRIAKLSDHKLYNHVALIFSGGRLLSYGYNSNFLHAEISAIRRLDRLYRPGNSQAPKNLHLVSFMVRRKNGNLGPSIPCEECSKAIRARNIRTVTYFDGKGWWNNGISNMA